MNAASPLDALVDAIADKVAAKLRPVAGRGQGSEGGPVQPVLLSVKDAAVYLGRSRQSVQHLIFDGELRAVRVGRRVHLDRRDLDAWIEEHKV